MLILRAPIMVRNLARVPAKQHQISHTRHPRDIWATLTLGDEKYRHPAPDRSPTQQNTQCTAAPSVHQTACCNLYSPPKAHTQQQNMCQVRVQAACRESEGQTAQLVHLLLPYDPQLHLKTAQISVHQPVSSPKPISDLTSAPVQSVRSVRAT